MKIGYVLQTGCPDIRKKTLSGPANHVWQIFRELQRLDHQMRLIVRYDGQIWKSDDLENFDPIPVPRYDKGPIRLFERLVRGIQARLHLPYANLFESLRFAQACCQELAGFDLLYERMGWMGYGGGLGAQWLNIPLVLEVNGDHLDELRSQGTDLKGIQYHLSIFLMKRAAQRVSHVIATGEGWKHKFVTRWNIDPVNISVVENGSELVDILEKKDLKSFSEQTEYHLKVRIAYCGGFEPWHGIPILINATRKAIDQSCDIHVLLIGSGSEEDKIKNQILKMGLEEKFTIAARVPISELGRMLSQSDIGVSPYCGRVEFSGLKLLDYKAAGLATIASGVNNQPAVLEHGRTGWIVPPCDEDALSRAIIKLASNIDLRQSIGQAARIEAEQIHSWQHATEQIQQIFNELLAK